MTAPVGDGSVYADFAGLDALKHSAAQRDPAALRQVAKQFESMFARMMIKSMRDASGTDPIFGSDQEKMVQGMYDDQLSLDMTKGKGLGLADVLMRQLQRMASSADSAAGQASASGTPAASSAPATQKATTTAPPQASTVSPTAQAEFVKQLWPAASQAGQQLGVDPRNLIAQAALETGWGSNVPRAASGESSNNLFGVKAGSQWSGASVTAPTQEYTNGTAVSTTGQFRAYDSKAQSFQDYVALLRGNPRYAAALNTGGNVQAFAGALQRGGYATDPDYAHKISAIASSLGGPAGANPALSASVATQPFKVASDLPIHPGIDTL